MMMFLACIGALTLLILGLLAALTLYALFTLKSVMRRAGQVVPSLVEETRPFIGTYNGKWRLNDNDEGVR